jgi:hypothetical protein
MTMPGRGRVHACRGAHQKVRARGSHRLWLSVRVWLSDCIKIPEIEMSVRGNIYCARKNLYSAQNSCNPENI